MIHKTSSTLVTLNHYSPNVRTMADSIQVSRGPETCIRGVLEIFARSAPVSRGLRRAVEMPYSCRNLLRRATKHSGGLGEPSRDLDDLWASATSSEWSEPNSQLDTPADSCGALTKF